MDGITYSNTYFFEKTLQFKGVLIEPTSQYNQLIVNRPNSKCYNLAVNYSCEDDIFIGNGATGGLNSVMSDDFKDIHHGKNATGYYVKCSPLKNIINDGGLPYIDLLSIDVEGGELIVLETIDFSIPIYVIVIELDGLNKDKDDKCRDILLRNGFAFNIRVNINEFWINETYFRKEKLFNANIDKITFSNMRSFGETPYLDMNHKNINELRDSLNR